MKACIPFFMFLLSSICIGLSLSAEEQEFYKPSDFRDISSCVISWEPVFGETKVYDLTKGEYPYPASGRYMAKEGWNSYPDGREIPVTNYSMEEEFPEKAYDPYFQQKEQSRIATERQSDFNRRIPIAADLHVIESLFPAVVWRRTHDVNEYAKAMKSGLTLIINAGVNQWFNIVVANKENYVDIRQVGKIYRISMDNKGTISNTELLGFSGLQVLCACRSNRIHGDYEYGKFALYDDSANEIAILDGNGQSWRISFFKRKFDTECWGCEHVEEIANFPSVLFYDRNYGIPRNAIRPPSNDPETGLPTDNWRYWKPRLVPDKPQSRYVQINLKTGEVEATYEGIHYARLRTPEIVEIPNVANEGSLGSALMKKGKQVAYLPYCRILPDNIQIVQEYPSVHTEVYLHPIGINVVDYEKMKLVETQFVATVNTESLSSCIQSGLHETAILTSKYVQNNLEVRTIYIYSIPSASLTPHLYCCATVPADFIKPGDKRMLYAFNGESIFIDNSGELLRIDVPKEALK